MSMKALLLPLLISFFFLISSCANSTSKVQVIGQPAEFDKQEAIWLIWPQVDHKEGFSNEEVSSAIVEAVSRNQKVVVACADSSIYASALSYMQSQAIQLANLSVKVIPSIEFWVRDMGPSFVKTNKGLAVADFQFDAWGYSDTTDVDSIIEGDFDKKAAEILGIPTIYSPLISEGGNREANGKGVIMASKWVEQGRNPDWTLEEITAEYKRVLGAEKVLWLNKGVYEDDHTFRGPLTLENGEKAYTAVTTDGHIDEFARFVNDSTIVLAFVPEEDLDDPIAQENHRRMEENLALLASATTVDGRAFTIVRMPLPKTMVFSMKPSDSVYDYISTLDYTDGSTFPEGEEIQVIAAGSYLNFTITNDLIIGQKFWRVGTEEAINTRDEQVRAQLEELFPNRTVIMIDAIAVNLGGGGIHCITMHQPAL